jgi:hypothetical protein
MKKLIMVVAFVCLLVPAYANDYLTKDNFWQTVESKWETKLPDYTSQYLSTGYSYNANADFNAGVPKEVAPNEYVLPVNVTTDVSYKNETDNSIMKKQYEGVLEMHVYHDKYNDHFWVMDSKFSEAESKKA